MTLILSFTMYALTQVYLCLGNSFHVAGEVIDLHLEFALLLLQLLFDALEVVDLLSQLCDAVRLLLAQSSGSGLMLQGGLLQVTTQLLELSLALLVHLDLGRSGSTGLLKPLTDLLKFPGEIGSLLLHLGPSSTLSLNLLLQLLNASLSKSSSHMSAVVIYVPKETNMYGKILPAVP